MKTVTLALSFVMVVLIVTSSVAGAYYYLTVAVPHDTSQTPPPSATDSSTQPPTASSPSDILPSSTQTLQPTLQPTTTQSATAPTTSQPPSPTFFPSTSTPNATSTSEPWTITASIQAKTTFQVSGGATTTFSPTSADSVFLIVNFDLIAKNNAGTLDIQNVLLVIDGVNVYHPLGYVYSLSTSSSGSPNGYVGTSTGDFVGNITREGVNLRVTYSYMRGITRTTEIMNVNSELASIYPFVYVAPLTAFYGGHHFQVQIAGSSQGKEFTVEPLPPLPAPQGYAAVSSSGNYAAVSRNASLYFFDSSSSIPSWIYTGKSQLEPPIVSSEGNRILVASGKTLLMFQKSGNQPLWTKDFAGMREYTMSSDGTRIAVAFNTNNLFYANLVDAANGNVLKRLDGEITPFVYATPAFSSNSKYLAIADATTLYIVDCSNSSKVWQTPTSDAWVYPFRSFRSVTISADGNSVDAIGINSATNSYMVQTYQNRSYTPAWTFASKDSSAITNTYSSLLSADGSSLILISGAYSYLPSADGSWKILTGGKSNVTMFNGQTGTPLWTKTQNDFQSAAISVSQSSDGNSIAIGCADETVLLLNSAGNIVSSRSGLGRQAAMSQDGKFIVAVSGTAVHLLNGATLAAVWTYSFS
jgi:hypothetical protein